MKKLKNIIPTRIPGRWRIFKYVNYDVFSSMNSTLRVFRAHTDALKYILMNYIFQVFQPSTFTYDNSVTKIRLNYLHIE